MDVTFDQLMHLFWWGTATVAIMCVLLLMTVALASFVVFRTRRDGPEQLFTPKPQPGDAGQVGDAYSDPEAERRFNWLGNQPRFVDDSAADDSDVPDGEDVMQKVSEGNDHKRFMQQMADVTTNLKK